MKRKKKEFSKVLLIQESVLVWITTIACLFFGYLCITSAYIGSLPWISVIISSVYAAYAVSQACYYSKSKAENTEKGIKYEATLAELKANKNNKDEGISI